VPIEYSGGSLITTFYSYVGANLVGDGSEARYSFEDFVGELTKCQNVLLYSLVDEDTSGKLTYPSTRCTSLPCKMIDIDVTSAATIKFKIHMTTSY
jgi:hypothetical protein